MTRDVLTSSNLHPVPDTQLIHEATGATPRPFQYVPLGYSQTFSQLTNVDEVRGGKFLLSSEFVSVFVGVQY